MGSLPSRLWVRQRVSSSAAMRCCMGAVNPPARSHRMDSAQQVLSAPNRTLSLRACSSAVRTSQKERRSGGSQSPRGVLRREPWWVRALRDIPSWRFETPSADGASFVLPPIRPSSEPRGRFSLRRYAFGCQDQERVLDPLVADGRGSTVAGINHEIVREAHQLPSYPFDELLRIAAGETAASHRSF